MNPSVPYTNLHHVGPRMSRQCLPATRSILRNPTKRKPDLEKGKLHLTKKTKQKPVLLLIAAFDLDAKS